MLAMLAAVATMTVPRLSAWLDDDTRNSARTIAALLRYLDERAAADRTSYRLLLDLDRQTVTVAQRTDGAGFKAPEEPYLQRYFVPVSAPLAAVITGRTGGVTKGTVTVWYGSAGLSEPLVLHLGRAGRTPYTVQALPVNRTVKVARGWLEVIL